MNYRDFTFVQCLAASSRDQVGIQPQHTCHARRLGAWGKWRSGIKEEPEGRGTAAELLTPSARAYKSSKPFGVMNDKPISSKTTAKP